MSDTDELLRQLQDVLQGTGDHSDHTREQIGRCVHCSCGARAQGKGVDLQDGVRRTLKRVYEVVLADGFVSYRTNDKDEALKRANGREGATVRETNAR